MALIYRFGDCELDEARSELRRSGVVVPLQPKPLELLLLLLRHRDRVLTKDELQGALWPDTVVTESSLTRAVSIARSAIGDTRQREWIRSIPRRGYRFVGDVRACETEPAAAGAARAAPVVAAGDGFVGREEPLHVLHTAWAGASAGRGGLVLVTGETGIGKTRLVEELLAGLEAAGAQTLIGRAEEGEGAPAFWLWVQALRQLDARGDFEALAARLGEGARRSLERLLDLDVDHVAGDAEAGQSPEQARFRFFDAVSRVLFAAARQRPLALVIEDIHWAGAASLRLLEHLARGLGREPMLVVATSREVHAARQPALVRSFAALDRLPHVVPLPLAGLSPEAVSALLEDVLERPVPDRLVKELLARTGGNPLFLRESLRLLAERGQLHFPELSARWQLDRLPQRAQDVVRRHLDDLSPEARALVDAMAVLGQDCAIPVLAGVAACDLEAALDHADEAVRAGVLRASERAGHYRFAHPLFQEVTYEALPPGQRTRLHQQAGVALEAQHGIHQEEVIAVLAHHYHLGLPAADAAVAFTHAIGAARRATRLLAYEQAAAHMEQALAAQEHMPGLAPEKRLDTLLAAGEAHRLGGDRNRRRALLTEALDVARSLGHDEAYVRAALGFCDMNEWGPRDPRAEAVLAEALRSLGPTPDVHRARILSRLSYLARLDRERAAPLAREAIAIARPLGDPDTLQEALYALHLTLAGPDALAERTALTEEMAALAAHATQHDVAVIAGIDVACDRLMQGRRADALREFDAALRIAGPQPHRSLVWHQQLFEAGRAALEGRFDEAARGIAEAADLGGAIGHPYAPLMDVGQRFYLLRDRGGLAELGPHFLPGQARGEARVSFFARAMAAAFHAEMGRTGLAREMLETIAAAGLAALPRGIDWLNAMGELAGVCCALPDAPHARELFALLEPYEALHAIVPVCVMYGGPVRLSLARLAAALGERDGARRLYEEALEACGPLRARPMRARIRVELGELLAGGPGRRVAGEVLAAGLEEAESLGMAPLAERARKALDLR